MRTKLADRHLPGYSKTEEKFNMVSHIIGAIMGIVVLISCILVAAAKGNKIGVVASAIYGMTMILLYTMSSIYHGLTHEKVKKVFQILDHCTIYFLIAGTYTPIALGALRGVSVPLGWTLFGLEWGIAILATVFTAIDLKKYGVFSMICYIVMGWAVVFCWQQALVALTMPGFKLLLGGGILYTIGAIVYGIGSKKSYMHSVFHVFVLLGSLLQFFSILFYAL